VLRSNVQRPAKGEQLGTRRKGLFSADLGDIGRVVLFRQMREDQIARAAVEDLRIGKKLADHVIGKMPGAAHDPLFDMPGIRADLEHFEIVVRFEQQKIGLAHVLLDKFGEVAEIGDDRDFQALGTERKSDRIGSIVRDPKRIYLDIADLEPLAGANVFDALKGGLLRGLVGFFPEHPDDFAMRRFGEIRRTTPEARKLCHGIGMVGVLVRDQDGIDAFGQRLGERFKAPLNFLAAQARVDEEGSVPGFEQRCVARTS
jgi:hypothetical protein